MISSHKNRTEAEIRKAQMKNVAMDSARYRRAHFILTDLRTKWKNREITSQQYSTIRGQAIAGDLDGATKGLATVIMDNLNRRDRA